MWDVEIVSASEIVRELQAKRIFKEHGVVQFLASRGLYERKSKIDIIKAMADHHIHDYNYCRTTS